MTSEFGSLEFSFAELPKKVFVTGTDTGVGKTVVSCAILLKSAIETGQTPAYLKPAQTGVAAGEGDAAFVRKLFEQCEIDVDIEVPYELAEALAPLVAAERAGKDLDTNVVASVFAELAESHEVVVVEGAGGLLVPFAPGVLMADLASVLGLPVVITCSPLLGTLNHSRLTVESALARGLEVVGVVISGWPAHPGIAEETNRERLADFTGVPLLGVIPEIAGLDTEAPNALALKALAGDLRKSDEN
ncbi:MAG: dethiobiotin synthase [Acidobacteria bacterium]|nr:MAG: dethiobiotin synthase [Acidobacteriota bacterium]